MNDYFSLTANGGVPRHKTLEVLTNPKLVANLVKRGHCFQCFAEDIDATGLCYICRCFLNDEERAASLRYYD